MKTTVTFIAAAAALAFTLPASAAANFEFQFDIDRTELATPEGANAVYEDLLEEISAHCAPTTIGTRFTQRRQTRQCVESTIDDAVAHINAPQLTAVHTERAASSAS